MARKRTLGKKQKSRKLKKSRNNKRRKTYRKMRGGGPRSPPVESALKYIKLGTVPAGTPLYVQNIMQHKKIFDRMNRMNTNIDDEELRDQLDEIFYPESTSSSYYDTASNSPGWNKLTDAEKAANTLAYSRDKAEALEFH